MGVTDYCALYFRLRGLQAPLRTEMTISDLQLIMEVAMWTAETGGTHRSDGVFAEVLHGAQASIAIPASEDGLAQVEGNHGYKWSVPDGNRLFELAGLGWPTTSDDRGVHLKQLESLAHEGHDYHTMRPTGELPPWAVDRPEYAEERVGKRTWVLSLSAFRPSDQKTVQLMSEAALNLDYGDPDDSMVRFLSWQHTAIKSLTASHERAHRRPLNSRVVVVVVVVVVVFVVGTLLHAGLCAPLPFRPITSAADFTKRVQGRHTTAKGTCTATCARPPQPTALGSSTCTSPRWRGECPGRAARRRS